MLELVDGERVHRLLGSGRQVLEVYLPYEGDGSDGPGAVGEDYNTYLRAETAARAHLGEALQHRPALDLAVPGAVRVHPSVVEQRCYPHYRTAKDGNLLPDEELFAALERCGLSNESEAVVYGRGQVPMMIASRVAWALLYAGVERVLLLDGGFPAWVEYAVTLRAGGPTPETDAGSPCASRRELFSEPGKPGDFPRASSQDAAAFDPAKVRRHLLATIEEVQSVASSARPAGDGGPCLVDVRRLDEHAGIGDDAAMYSFMKVAGHISGAVWQGNWDVYVDYGTEPRRATGQEDSKRQRLESTVRPNRLRLKETARLWSALDIVPDSAQTEKVRDASRSPPSQRDLIFFCGTGWRSAVGVVIALLLGYDARNYDGGFFEWSEVYPDAVVRLTEREAAEKRSAIQKFAACRSNA